MAMRGLRIILLCCALAGAGWFLRQPLTATVLVERARDLFDPRPARRILLLGNSRTFYNAMPTMLRAIADSAQAPQKYQVTLEAPGGASFESLWGTAQVQRLLTERWDDAILQGESRGQGTPEFERSFDTFGARLLGAVRLRAGAPRLVVNWAYDSALFDDGDPDGSGRDAYFQAIQRDTLALAERSGARPVNVGRIWGVVRREHPALALTVDGNHPSLAGSYLFALLLYADLSHGDVAAVGYVPAGLDPEVAAMLREAVRAEQSFGGV